VTTVYVTHDQTEAMTLGQRVAVMRAGRVVQVDEPQTLYREPADLFVAAFIGSPAMNLVEAVVDGGDAVFGEHRVPLDPARRPARDLDRVVLGIRPEAFEESSFAPPHLPRIRVEAEVVEELGADAHVFFSVAAAPVVVEARAAAETDTLLAAGETLFTARIDPAAVVRVGQPVTLAVDPARFHFFDPDGGASLVAGAATDAATHRAGVPG
jgi:multiple sugar transport system ATP-binding protein